MAGLIVLESLWNQSGQLLDEEPSVLPYLQGIRQSLAWEEDRRIDLVYRRFHTTRDLRVLLREVLRKQKAFRCCYITSHGERRKLLGLGGQTIRLETLTEYCRRSHHMGYLFGACDFLTPDTALKFLTKTGARFVAGYQKSIPWTESMLVDSLFLSYLLAGTMKWVRTKHGERVPPLSVMNRFDVAHTNDPQKMVAKLYRDFPLAYDITFSLFTLSRQRGRKPELVNSLSLHRSVISRSRRLVRHL